MKNILFGLIPALMWGVQPIIMTKIGGKPAKKVVGMGLGIFIASLLIGILRKPNNLTLFIIVMAFIDGLALSFALINQIKGLHLLGVSKGTPISTGTQLIGTSLVAVIFFKEWTSYKQYTIGTLALSLIVIGISMTSYEEDEENKPNKLKEGLLILILSSLGFVLYTVILKIYNIEIWDALIPQGLGMLIGSYLLAKKEEPEIVSLTTFKHILTGFIFAMGNLTLMISNELNGLALGFTLTQMNVVIATLGGLVFLRERKTRKEFLYTSLGLISVVLGGILIGMIKS